MRRKTTQTAIENLDPHVTILICAKNEAENLRKNLPHFFEQSYFSYEVIVVNHQSEDNSSIVLNELKSRFKNLHVLEVAKHTNKYVGKKQALYEGIKSAKGEIILFTDADCRPIHKDWMKEVVEEFREHYIDIVIGYAPYEKFDGCLSDLIQFETLNTLYLMDRINNIGIPYMGTGRNLAIRKSKIHESYWEKNTDIGFGDDDFMVQEFGTDQNVLVCSSEKSFVYSEPKKSWKEWFLQKIRHQQAGFRYKIEVIAVLLAYQTLILARLVALIYIISCINKNFVLIYFVIPIVILSWIQFLTIGKAYRVGINFGKYFLFQNLMILYYFVFPILTFFYKKNIWQRNTPYQSV